MSTKNFILAIKNIILPLSQGSDRVLAEVNGYNKKTKMGFPAVNIAFEGDLEINREDSQHNERTTPIIMRVIFPNKDGEVAELARVDVMDAILDTFDKRATIDTLAGVQDIWEVTGGERFEDDQPEPIMGFEFTIQGRNAVEFTD